MAVIDAILYAILYVLESKFFLKIAQSEYFETFGKYDKMINVSKLNFMID